MGQPGGTILVCIHAGPNCCGA